MTQKESSVTGGLYVIPIFVINSAHSIILFVHEFAGKEIIFGMRAMVQWNAVCVISVCIVKPV